MLRSVSPAAAQLGSTRKHESTQERPSESYPQFGRGITRPLAESDAVSTAIRINPKGFLDPSLGFPDPKAVVPWDFLTKLLIESTNFK
jgi:hypothetical protein